MTKPTVPTNIDDAFVAGWYSGRGMTDQPIRFNRSTPTHISREYERGVYEGMRFEKNLSSPDNDDLWHAADRSY